MITVGLLVPAPLLKVKGGRSKKRRIRIMITGMIIIAVAAVTIAFAASANAAGTNATNVATSAEKSSQMGSRSGRNIMILSLLEGRNLKSLWRLVGHL